MVVSQTSNACKFKKVLLLKKRHKLIFLGTKFCTNILVCAKKSLDIYLKILFIWQQHKSRHHFVLKNKTYVCTIIKVLFIKDFFLYFASYGHFCPSNASKTVLWWNQVQKTIPSPKARKTNLFTTGGKGNTKSLNSKVSVKCNLFDPSTF